MGRTTDFGDWIIEVLDNTSKILQHVAKWILSVYNGKFIVEFSDIPPFQEFIYIFPDSNQYYGTSTVLKHFESTVVGNAAY